jgi:hypothetical protein
VVRRARKSPATGGDSWRSGDTPDLGSDSATPVSDDFGAEDLDHLSARRGAALHRDDQGGSLLPLRLGGKHAWRSTSEQPLLERPSGSSGRPAGTPGGAPWSPAASATSSSGTTLPSTVGSPRSSPRSSSLESTRSPACSPSSWSSAWPSWPVRPAPWSLPTTATGWAVGGRWRPGSCSWPWRPLASACCPGTPRSGGSHRSCWLCSELGRACRWAGSTGARLRWWSSLPPPTVAAGTAVGSGRPSGWALLVASPPPWS